MRGSVAADDIGSRGFATAEPVHKMSFCASYVCAADAVKLATCRVHAHTPYLTIAAQPY